MGKRKLSNDEKTGLAGCVFIALVALFNIAWIAFVVWAIYTVVSWLVTK